MTVIKALAKMAHVGGFHIGGGADDEHEGSMMGPAASSNLLSDSLLSGSTQPGGKSPNRRRGASVVGPDASGLGSEQSAANRTPSRALGLLKRAVMGTPEPQQQQQQQRPHSSSMLAQRPHSSSMISNRGGASPPNASSPTRRRGASGVQQRGGGGSPDQSSAGAASPATSTSAAAGSAAFLARGRRGSLVASANAAFVPPKPSEPPKGFTDSHLSLMDLFELLTEHEVVFTPCEIVHLLHWRGGAPSLHIEDVVRWIARAAIASGRCPPELDYEAAIALVHGHLTTNPLASDERVTRPLMALVGEPLLRQLSRWVGKLQVAGMGGKGFDDRIKENLATGQSLVNLASPPPQQHARSLSVASSIDLSANNNSTRIFTPAAAVPVGSSYSVAQAGASSTPSSAVASPLLSGLHSGLSNNNQQPSSPFGLAAPVTPARSGTTGSVLDTDALEIDPSTIIRECVSRCPQCHDRTTAMCVSVAAGAKTVQDRKASQNEAALKALLCSKCLMMEHPLFLLSVVVPFHAFQLLNQLIVAAPERALRRLPTVLSPAAALQLDSLELYRDSCVAGGKTFDLPNKDQVMKATFIEELLAETREMVSQRIRAARLKQQQFAAAEAKLDDDERAKRAAQRKAQELLEQGRGGGGGAPAASAQEQLLAKAKMFLPQLKGRLEKYHA